jgi:two-component system, cell cycle response regulator DivK
VLLVDDSADVREMWREWLKLWDFQVDEAADGAEALCKAQLHAPDVVLMDLWMPVLDGLDATKALRANPATATVPIVALSAAYPADATAVRQAGCDTYLPKPLEPTALLEAVRASFAHRPAGNVPPPRPARDTATL